MLLTMKGAFNGPKTVIVSANLVNGFCNALLVPSSLSFLLSYVLRALLLAPVSKVLLGLARHLKGFVVLWLLTVVQFL
jgi:hypothetical protein